MSSKDTSMSALKNLKKKLHGHCLTLVEEKIRFLNTQQAELHQSVEEETKSSVGDKYETGRSMLHLEMDKTQQQLQQAMKEKEVLDQITARQKECNTVELGALVEVEDNTYYLAVGIGPLTLEERTFLVISPVSPIGKCLDGKSTGEKFEFRGLNQMIKAIV